MARRMALRGPSSAELTAQETVALPVAAPLQLNAGMRRRLTPCGIRSARKTDTWGLRETGEKHVGYD